MKPLHVVHIAGTANGAAWMHQQLVGLRERGYTTTAIIGGHGGSLEQRLIADGIPYHVLDLDPFSSRTQLSGGLKLWRLVRLLRRLRPDVVHYHLYQSIIMGRLAAWLADVPARFSMIPGPYQVEAPVLGDVDVATTWADSKVIASCEHTRTLYARAGGPREHVELVYYGQDATLFEPERADGARVRAELGIEPDRPVVGDVAYYYPPLPDSPFTPQYLVNRGVKGHEVLLRAVPKVLERVPNALFLLVGKGWGPDGPAYEAQLREMARRLGVAHAVRFTGERADVPDVLAAFDVSIQCSLNENLGGSIESLLMARPLVATAVGGLVDAVIHERTGLLVPPDDSTSLADAISRLLLDRAFAERLGRDGRAHALQHLTLERAVRDLDTLYRSELERAEARGPAERRGYRRLRSIGRAVSLAGWGHTIVRPVVRAGRLSWRRGSGLTIVQMVGSADSVSGLVQICRRVAAEGHDVFAVIGRPEDGPVSRGLTASGIAHTRVRLPFATGTGLARRFADVLRLPIVVLQLAWMFRRLGADVVHAHDVSAIGAVRLAAWMARVPIRLSTLPEGHPRTTFARLVDRLTGWMDQRVTAGTEAHALAAERVERTQADRDRIRQQLGIPPESQVIGLLAYSRAARHRSPGVTGHEDVIAALHGVRQRLPDARFLLLGAGWRPAGALRQRLVKRCLDEGLGGAAIAIGAGHTIDDALAVTDVAVQCSIGEHHGGTISAWVVESGEAGHGETPESNPDGATGARQASSDPDAVANAIARRAQQPEYGQWLAREGRTMIREHYAIEETAERMLTLYEEIQPRAAHIGAPERDGSA